jgi:tetratricopeptide (TPR) repeat protein
MKSKCRWVAPSVVAFQVVVACIAMVACACAQEAVMRDGELAIACHHVSQQNGRDYVWGITRVSLSGESAFSVPVDFGRDRPKAGTLYLTANRVAFHPNQQQRGAPLDFDESRAAVVWKEYSYESRLYSYDLSVSTTRKKYHLSPLGTAEGDIDSFTLFSYSPCAAFVHLAFSDFTAAEKQFKQLTKHLSPLLEAAFRNFQPKTAAWRALPTKPPLGPEADRHWILAENAFKEKNFASAVEHYESALEIQPMWPTGWFNLAMIYAEQNNYADATDCMKHYLELTPDAPDARSAREQMIIWEDKAKH